MSSSPKGPGDDELWLNAFSNEAHGDATDFLARPAYDRLDCQFFAGLSVVTLRRIGFGSGAIALA